MLRTGEVAHLIIGQQRCSVPPSLFIPHKINASSVHVIFATYNLRHELFPPRLNLLGAHTRPLHPFALPITVESATRLRVLQQNFRRLQSSAPCYLKVCHNLFSVAISWGLRLFPSALTGSSAVLTARLPPSLPPYGTATRLQLTPIANSLFSHP